MSGLQIRRRDVRLAFLLIFILIAVCVSLLDLSDSVIANTLDSNGVKWDWELPGWKKTKAPTQAVPSDDMDEEATEETYTDIQETVTSTTSSLGGSPAAVKYLAHMRPQDQSEVKTGFFTETSIPNDAHAHGYTVLDNLYLRNGTFYIVTYNSAASRLPERKNMIAKPLNKHKILDSGKNVWVNVEPDDDDLQFVFNPSQAKRKLGERPVRQIDGVTVIVNDPASSVDTFYKWWAEVILGGWRVYSKVDNATVQNKAFFNPRMPERFLFPGITKDELEHTATKISFPNATIETSEYWRNLTSSVSEGGGRETVVFERVILVSREAAYKSPHALRWLKMISGATEMINVPSELFWKPIRDALVKGVVGRLPEEELERDEERESRDGLDGLDGFVGRPVIGKVKTTTDPEIADMEKQGKKSKPLVVYISRQNPDLDLFNSTLALSRRRLDEKDHEGLIDALQVLERDGVCDFQVMNTDEDIRKMVEVVAKSTIIIGVHGLGLTHQLWMNPSSHSTVLEIVWPGAYVYDYEIVSRNLGHKHYAIWNDTAVAYRELGEYKGVFYGENFDSNNIPVHGSAIAKIVRSRLSNWS